ncbi:N/A [soil metagenome]
MVQSDPSTGAGPRSPIKRQALELLRARNVRIETVLDVGVERGTPELIEAFPDQMHILFEPVAEFAPFIERAYKDVAYRLLEVAVSDHSGTGVLQIDKITGNDVTHSALVETANKEANQRQIQTTTLDDAVALMDLAKPYLLKIDIDGQELRALAGASNVLSDCAIVIIEVPVYELSARLRALEAVGFRLFDMVEPCYYDGSFWQADAIFIRNEVHAQHFSSLSNSGFEPAKYEMFKG